MSTQDNAQLNAMNRLLELVEKMNAAHEQNYTDILTAMKENNKVNEKKTSVLDKLASHVMQLQTGQQMLMDAIMGVQHTAQMLMQQASIARPGIYNHPVQGMQYPNQQPYGGQWMPNHGYDINSGGGRNGFGRSHFSGQHSAAPGDEVTRDRIEIDRMLSLVRDTVIPSGEDIDPYARMVIDLGAHLLRGTAIDSKNAATNRGTRFFVYENQSAGYLVFLVPDISWSNRVNARQPHAVPVGIFTALVFTKIKKPTEKQVSQIVEEVLRQFHATNTPVSSGIASLSAYVNNVGTPYPYQGLNFEQPILNLGFHPHHYLSFDMQPLVAPMSSYGTL